MKINAWKIAQESVSGRECHIGRSVREAPIFDSTNERRNWKVQISHWFNKRDEVMKKMQKIEARKYQRESM